MFKLDDLPLPLLEKDNIQAAFASSSKAYAQVSTLHQGLIYPRTVHIHYHEQDNVFFINTHTQSRKYLAAQKQELMAGCYWNIAQSIQYVWQAKLNILSALHDTSLSIDPKQTWLLMREEVRLAYYLDADDADLKQTEPKDYPLNTPAPNHGVLVFRPDYWDIFHVSQQEHRFSQRTIHQWQDHAWSKQNVSILRTP